MIKESSPTYPDGDHQKTNVSDLGSEPLEEGARQGHEGAIREDRNHCNNVKYVLPNADTTGLLSQRPSSTPAKFVSIESHGQQMIDENDEWRNRQSCAEASHIGKLYHGNDILREAVMIRKHHLLPNVALSLLKEKATVDEPLLPMLPLRR